MRISVIMSIYNEPIEWIERAINSILNQTYSDFEFIIVNDNPERILNKSLLLKYKKKDKRIILINNFFNIGLTKSLNKALKISKADIIARMDADDISHPNRFKLQIDILDNNSEIGVCGSWIREFGLSSNLVKYPRCHEEMILFIQNPFAHPVVMFRKFIYNYGNVEYSEEFRKSQDYNLWSQLYDKTSFYNIQEVLLDYRVSNNQITSVSKDEQGEFAQVIRRRNFRSFCESMNICFLLQNKISINDINNYRLSFFNDEIELSRYQKSALRIFFYYIYRSLDFHKKREILYSLIIKGDILKLGGRSNILKLIYSIFLKKLNRLL